MDCKKIIQKLQQELLDEKVLTAKYWDALVATRKRERFYYQQLQKRIKIETTN